jgi:superfamily II DNA or RNA helicase
MTKFDPEDFGLLIYDECHHATSSSYRRCLDWYKRNPNLKILGVTATPDRSDEKALGQVFDSVAYDYEVMDAIQGGWLVNVQQQMVVAGHLDLSSVRTTAGDLNAGDLSRVLTQEQTLHEIAGPTIDICGTKRALVFAASVEQAERLCEILNRHRPGCAGWVCGKTDKDERKKTLAAFREGKIQFVCNVGVLTEGFDDDGVEYIIMARPTKSRALYAQMAGRGTRPHGSVAKSIGLIDNDADRRLAIKNSPKPTCTIVDFVGNAGKHKLCCSADILGGNYTDEEIAKATLKAKRAMEPVDMTQALEDARKEINDKKMRDAAKRAAIQCKAKYSVTNVNPFDVFDIQPTAERGWDKGRHLTEKQEELLNKNGIPTKGITYTQGKALLAEMFRRWDKKLPTFKQQKVLNKAGFVAPMRPSETQKAMAKLSQRWASK